MDAPVPAAGLTTMELVAEWMAAHFLIPGGGLSTVEDDRNNAVARLTMEMLKSPGKVPKPLMRACGMRARFLASSLAKSESDYVAVVCLDTQWGLC
jgi:hypothetical protein